VTTSAGVTVLVRNHAPAELSLTADPIVEGGTATLNGSFTDPDADDTHMVVIDWADDSSQTLSLAAGVTTFTPTHGYATAGDYTLGVTVIDSHDASTTGSVKLTVRTKDLGGLLDALRALITSWNLDKGTETSLLAKVDSAQANVGESSDKVCSSLNALGNEVSAQTDKKLSMTQVTEFWTLLAEVDAAVPCTSGYTGAAPSTPQRAPTRHN
jgi:PKD repeat protein